ncbi:restriction endonuclease subunit S [Rodentibacter trehalosifermentans]|uniref:Type I restriction modification DNA specificity domain-containing protein n=1 Tax=Rodentibacter trehalosifermentans TaxID=1908263 RepID=A0A1V3IWR4_9PAST|nr:restriction endonuclease subunit S [Rodentibacter trehalosifermentans]OOF46404.1 hypothetical protein BKK51_02660 [Rodentibacter trehalosifermentans]OOF53655.1 hypothetical protein BKK53_00625 [Rodentibacter trehalosifermentans]
MSKYKEFLLEDLIIYISRGIAPKYTEELNNSAIIINQKCIRNFQIDLTLSRRNDLQKRVISNDKQVKLYDILVNSTGVGTLGRVSQFLNKIEEIVSVDSHVTILRPNIEKINPLYLGYLLKAKQNEIEGLGIGSTGQTELSREALKSIRFNILTDQKYQKEISEFLLDIDKKIELNTQINQTLEQIAQAIFKSWFVDFDPVRAKADALADGKTQAEAELAAQQIISGKTPEELTDLSQTHPDQYAELAEIAKAFPSEFEEVEGFGEVPRGWVAGSFSDITQPRREKIKNTPATVLSAVSSGELVKSEEYFTKQVYSKNIDKYLKVYQWDFAYNPARINIGSIGLHEKEYLGAVSPVYEVFSVTNGYYWFMKRILDLETTKTKIQTLCTGSVRQTLKLKDFQSIDCIIPDNKLISIFNRKWEEYHTFILKNNENSKTLSKLRDLLLPRLLNGKVKS